MPTAAFTFTNSDNVKNINDNNNDNNNSDNNNNYNTINNNLESVYCWLYLK